jgi:hypothetical protein
LTEPRTAAVGLDDRGGVALQRLAEGVIGGEEEPGIAARLDDRLSRAMGEHIRVVGPVDCVWGAGLAGQVGGRRSGIEVDSVLLFDDVIDGEPDAGIGHVGDHVDLVFVEPFAR